MGEPLEGATGMSGESLKAALAAPESLSDRPSPVSDTVLGLLLLGLAAWVIRYLEQIPSEAEMILRIAAVGLAIGGLGVLTVGVRGLRSLPPTTERGSASDVLVSRLRKLLDQRILVVPVSEILMVLGIVVFVLVIPRLGFFVASGLLIATMLLIYRERRWFWIVPVSTLVVYGLDWLFFGFLNLRAL